jgi:hypothetical protein
MCEAEVLLDGPTARTSAEVMESEEVAVILTGLQALWGRGSRDRFLDVTEPTAANSWKF